jgi:hypothetical protein
LFYARYTFPLLEERARVRYKEVLEEMARVRYTEVLEEKGWG